MTDDCGSCWTFEHKATTALSSGSLDSLQAIMREGVGWLAVVIMFHAALQRMR